MKEIGYAEREAGAESEPVNETKAETGHSSNSVFTDTKDEDFEEFTSVPAITDQKEEEGEASGRWCRFCWAGEATVENPLIGTCKCAGTVAQIHFDCLCSWLNIRR